jgi:ABC-type uncharacterized transport system involved in gliding motility auxiliary subunit
MKKYLQKLDTLGLLLLVAAAVWYSVSNVWEKWNLGLAIAGASILIVGIIANYKQIMDSLGKRSSKYAANYVVSLILVIALVSGLNYLGQKHSKRFDTTKSGQFTLAPQTVKVLENLKQDVQIKAFFQGGENASLKELLLEYKAINPHIRFELIDPDRQPDLAKQNNVTAYGTVIVSYGGKDEKIEKRSEEVREEDLTNAIIKVEKSEIKKVYFVQGHGEKDISDTDKTGYSDTKKAMADQGYAVDSTNLASLGKVPDDATVLILAGPRTEPFPQELQFINDFINKGGSLLIMVDPKPSPSLESFLKDWGVKVDNDMVLDASGAGKLFGTGPAVPLVLSYEPHKITDRFNAMTFFPYTRSLELGSNTPNGTTVEPLFKSNQNSWGETDLENLFKGQPASRDEKQDLKGPLTLAFAVTKEIKPISGPTHKARLVATGTSNFPINAYFSQQGNGNMFLNMVSWLAQDEDLISIRPKNPDDRRILLSASQLSILRLITLIALPGIALIIGIVVVWNRRRR